MADRDITIPMGPDRTGEIDLPPINFGEAGGEVEFSGDVQADEVAYAGFNESEEGAEEYHVGGISDDEATAQGIDDVQMSFLALKDSIGQGRELKAREKELDEFAAALDDSREELADREDILANYQVIVTDLDNQIVQYSQDRDACNYELKQAMANLDETSDALARMREYHDGQMDPFEKNLGRARAYADQAKNDERSRKSELSAAETELRRAETNDDKTMATARRDQVKDAYNEARSRSESAKEALDKAQRAYDDAVAQVEQAESPLERTIEDLETQIDGLKEDIAGLEEDISIARKRRQYCDTVFQYPEETAKLREQVQADEEKMLQLDAEADELRDRLSQSKEQSKKAKIAIGIVIAVIIIIIILAVFVIGH